ncbi:neprilysin-1-like isoform X3 [Rhynchophorus ferrugineus]|uniref:neprilysin-1-like isoform X3 n=1 Tax=Rhynchophorus ferrugineus TaxID=354439 RepID=UPI003FCC79C5
MLTHTFRYTINLLPSRRLVNFCINLISFKMQRFAVLVILFSNTLGNVPLSFRTKDQHNKTSNESESSACDNFYKLSCDQWMKETTKPDYEPHWNHFISASYQINEKIRNILEDDDQNGVIKEAQIFYRSCIDFQEQETFNFRDLKVMLALYYNKWMNNEQHIDWVEVAMGITKTFNINPILKFYINIDYKNTKQYIPYIEPGNLIFPSDLLLNTQIYQKEINAYIRWISRTLRYLFTSIPISPIKIVEFEVTLAQLMSNKMTVERNTTKHFSDRFNYNFQKSMNNILLSNIARLEDHDLVVIKHSTYLNDVLFLLNTMDRRFIANYLIWYIAKDFSRDITKYMKTLNFLIDQAVLGVEKDIPRDIECANKVLDNFEYVVVSKYLGRYFDKNVLSDVQEMANDIHENFHMLLLNNSWLSEETKRLSLDKIKNIHFIIGFPKWISNKSAIEQYYIDIRNLSDNHLLNILTMKRFKAVKNLRLFGHYVDEALILQNLVWLLQKPFYSAQWPKMYNYGALGSLIGHEISHSLDTTGRKANSNGTILKWWPNQDIWKYNKKILCFSQFYDNKIKQPLVTGENIADNIGLDISYQGYIESYFSKLDEVFWGNQDRKTFFMHYSQMWCEFSNNRDLFNDEHTDVEKRVNQAVTNNKYFNKIYHCKKSIKPLCKLW